MFGRKRKEAIRQKRCDELVAILNTLYWRIYNTFDMLDALKYLKLTSSTSEYISHFKDFWNSIMSKYPDGLLKKTSKQMTRLLSRDTSKVLWDRRQDEQVRDITFHAEHVEVRTRQDDVELEYHYALPEVICEYETTTYDVVLYSKFDTWVVQYILDELKAIQ